MVIELLYVVIPIAIVCVVCTVGFVYYKKNKKLYRRESRMANVYSFVHYRFPRSSGDTIVEDISEIGNTPAPTPSLEPINIEPVAINGILRDERSPKKKDKRCSFGTTSKSMDSISDRINRRS